MPDVNPPTESSAWDQADDGTNQPPKKKRRKWPWVIVGLLGLLLLLVLLAPMIASTGPVRSAVVSKVNENLNGKLDVADWSIGWTSGVTLKGVKIDDERGARVLEVNEIRVPMSLIDAARGNIDLGEVVIDKPNLVNVQIYEDGSTNLDKLAKETAKEAKPESSDKPAGDGKLPDVKGKITIRELRGTINSPKAVVKIDPSDITINIPNINSPIENNLKLNYRVGNSPPSSIAVAGKVDAIKDNQLDLNGMAVDQKVDISNADLAIATPFLEKANVSLAGVANGSLIAKLEGQKQGNIEGQFTVKNFVAGGEALKGDQFKSSTISIPISVATAEGAIAIKTLKVETDQLLVDVTGQTTQQALQNLAEQKPPGAEGKITVALSTKDLPGLVNSLPNTLGLQKDAKITSGDVKARVELATKADRIVVTQVLDVQAAGTNAGKPVALEPVHLDTAVTAIPTGGKMPELRDLALNLKSAFATATGGGQSIAGLNINGNVDLAKLRQQLAQFIDLGPTDFAGAGTFEVTSKGDLTQPKGQADLAANLKLTNLVLRGVVENKDVTQEELIVSAGAKVIRGEKEAIERLASATLTFRSGRADARVVVLDATATNIGLQNTSVERFDVTKLEVNLPRAQQQLGSLLDLPIVADSGSVGGTITGSYKNDTVTFDQKLQLTNVSLSQVDATTKQRKPLLQNETEDIVAAGSVAMPKDEAMTAVLSALSVTSSNNLISIQKSGAAPLTIRIKDKAIGGSGELKIASDLKQVNDIVQAMGAQPVATTSAGQLQSGVFDATLKLDAAQSGTNIQLTGAVKNLTVTTNQQPIANENVSIALAASTPADFSGVTISSAAINSSFVKTNVSDTKLILSLPGGGTPGMFDMLQSAKIEIAVPDLAKTQAIADAFTPPATQPAATPGEPPAPPLAMAGTASVNLDIARDPTSNALRVKTAQIGASNVSLVRSQRRFEFKQPINIQLAADIASAGDKLQEIKVTSLAGDLTFAKLAMPTPIVVSNLSSETPAVNGQIAVSGAIEPVTQLLSVIQNAEPMPYRGSYALAQHVTTQGNALKLAGEINVTQFAVLQKDNKPAFTEEKLVVTNDIVADTTAKNATINALSLRMLSSQAAGVAVKGAVKGWETQRVLEGVTCDLSYDLAKIWTIVYPMMSAEQQKSYADMKLAGVHKKTFTVRGSYPAVIDGKPATFQDSIKSLAADGAFAFDQIATQGLDVRNYEIPIALRRGHLATIYGDKPRGENTAKPAVANGTGSLDLSRIDVDLTAPEPLVSIGRNQNLLKDVPLNPVLADAIGKFAAVLFKDSKNASGLLSATVIECNNVPLGELATKPDSKGKARIDLAIKDLRLDGWVSRGIAAVAQLGSEGIVGDVRESYVSYAAGQTQSDIKIFITRKGSQWPLRFNGGIKLDTLELKNTAISIPPQLFGSDQISAAFPNGMQVPITGTVTNYKIADVGSIVKQNIGGVVGGVIGDLTGQNKQRDQNPKATTQPAQQKQPDPVGELIDIFGKKKK